MSKVQRKLVFIFSLIIGLPLICYSFNKAFGLNSPPLWDWSDIFYLQRRAFLRDLVKQPTLCIGIAVIGIGIFIFKGGKA